MSLDPSTIFISLLFGAVGIIYLSYGKRRQRADMRLCGLCLLVYPLLVNQLLWLIVVGVALCLLPPIIARFA